MQSIAKLVTKYRYLFKSEQTYSEIQRVAALVGYIGFNSRANVKNTTKTATFAKICGEV